MLRVGHSLAAAFEMIDKNVVLYEIEESFRVLCRLDSANILLALAQ